LISDPTLIPTSWDTTTLSQDILAFCRTEQGRLFIYHHEWHRNSRFLLKAYFSTNLSYFLVTLLIPFNLQSSVNYLIVIDINHRRCNLHFSVSCFGDGINIQDVALALAFPSIFPFKANKFLPAGVMCLYHSLVPWSVMYFGMHRQCLNKHKRTEGTNTHLAGQKNSPGSTCHWTWAEA